MIQRVAMIFMFLQGNLISISDAAFTISDDEAFRIEYKRHHIEESEPLELIQSEFIHVRPIPSLEHLHPPHSCFEAKRNVSETEVITLCYPLIIVAGLFKCGTSALFEMLDQHDRIYGGIIKENCIYKPYYNDHEDALWRFLLSLEKQTHEAIKIAQSTTKDQTLLSGSMQCNPVHVKLLRIKAETLKNVFLIRNYADWTWSTFNFYFLKNLEKESRERERKIGKYHPQEYADLFHELVEASLAHSHSIDGVDISNTLELMMNYFKDPASPFQMHYKQLLDSTQDDQNILITNNELLSEDPELFWAKLTEFLGFRPRGLWASHPSMHKWKNKNYRVNSGNAPRSISNNSTLTHVHGVYADSGGRPLRFDTIALLNKVWYEECLWAYNMTGYKYEACFEGAME